jgi:SAM-dependent methyltransferase
MSESVVRSQRIQCRLSFPVTYHSDRLSWWQGNAALWPEYLQGNGLRINLLQSVALKAAELAADARQPPRIVDIGCGEGQLLRLCRNAVPSAELRGVDFCAAMLEQARRRSAAASIDFGIVDIEERGTEVPLDQDVVVSVLLLDEMERIDEAFDNLSRATRRGGWLLAVTLDPMHELFRYLPDVYRHALDQMPKDEILIEKHFSIGEATSPFPYCRVIRSSTVYDEAGRAHGLKLHEHYSWRGPAARRSDPEFEFRVFQKP